MGLPVPQIVLAESKDKRGSYLVLDGKQRLLSLLQFWGLGAGAKNRYALSGLQILTHLNRRKLADLEGEPTLELDLNALLNQTIRTVVIRNWPDIEFLHLVFLRLNTGSVRLSPQELRQALIPGKYTDWVDEAASSSESLKMLLRLSEPDYRMRDVELLARFMAFRFFLSDYPGRMKKFLDSSFERLNSRWASIGEANGGIADQEATDAIASFEAAVEVLRVIFGTSEVARKPGSRPFNRALFDLLVFYAQDKSIRTQMQANPQEVRDAYQSLFKNSAFVSSVDRDTAGLPNTAMRLTTWGRELQKALNLPFNIPTLIANGKPERIDFDGF
ncbi:MAG: hypothetical protein QOG82_60 [Actinomycetota bacterium]|nr:hypothetical protein [Actinomycetota bacterium]